MVKHLIFLFSFLPVLLIGQTEKSEKLWQLGISVRPSLNGVFDHQSDNSSTFKVGFSSYFTTLYEVGPILSISAGLGFGSHLFSRVNSNYVFNWDINPQVGIISTSVYEEEYKTASIELPVLFHFRLKNQLYASAGIQADYRQVKQNDRKVTSSTGQIEQWKGTPIDPKITASLLIGLGYNFSLNEKTNLRIEPLFKWNVSDQMIYISNLYGFALQIGCFIRL